eukprot:SAG11_NODE_12299_length_710_cov_1.168576_2_plen_47_part_01
MAGAYKRVGAARPKIVTMAGGALLLVGGRPAGQVEDPMVWLNPKVRI